MADKVYGLTKRAVERTALVVRRDLGTLPRAPRTTQRVFDGGSGGGCDTQNTIWDVTVFGTPTGGSFTMLVTVNSVSTTLTFNYNDSAATVKTTLATHSEIASADLTVTGGPFPSATVRVEFIATLAGTLILQPTADYASLTGGAGRGIIVQMAQRGHV